MQSAGTWSNSPYQTPFKSTTKTTKVMLQRRTRSKHRRFPVDRRALSVSGLFSCADDVVVCNLKLTKGGVISYKCVICSRMSSFFVVVPFMQTAHPAASLAVICMAY